MNTKTEDFLKQLFYLHSNDGWYSDVEEEKVVFSALMMMYGVQYRHPIHCNHELRERIAKHDMEVEDLFLDEINTVRMSQVEELFTECCYQYMDFSKSVFVKSTNINLGKAFQSFKKAI